MPQVGDASYWKSLHDAMAAKYTNMRNERNRLQTTLDIQRSKVENLERMRETDHKQITALVEQVRAQEQTIRDLQESKDAMGEDLVTVKSTLGYCRRQVKDKEAILKQHQATVADLKAKLWNAKAKVDVAALTASEECDEKVYALERSRRVLWSGVVGALDFLEKRGPWKKKVKNILLDARSMGLLDGSFSYDTELAAAKEALFEQRDKTKAEEKVSMQRLTEIHKLRRELKELKKVIEDGRCENYPSLTLAYLWGKWFPKRDVPKVLSADHLHHAVMSDYERRLRSVQDEVARSSMNQMEKDCRQVCDICRQMADEPFVGEPYPDPLNDGEWVHNFRERGGGAIAVRCEASAIREESQCTRT